MDHLDRRVDDQGNVVTLYSTKYRFKNLSVKSGFLDKVEYLPNSLDTAISYSIVSIDKQKIGWREEKIIEVRYAQIAKREEILRIGKQGAKEIVLDVKLYDNRGRLILTMDGSPYLGQSGALIGNYPPEELKKMFPK